MSEKLKCRDCQKTRDIKYFTFSGYCCDQCRIIKKDKQKKEDEIRQQVLYKQYVKNLAFGLPERVSDRITEELIHVHTIEDLKVIINGFHFERELKLFWVRQSRGEVLPLEYMRGYITDKYLDKSDKAIFYLKEWRLVY